MVVIIKYLFVEEGGGRCENDVLIHSIYKKGNLVPLWVLWPVPVVGEHDRTSSVEPTANQTPECGGSGESV